MNRLQQLIDSYLPHVKDLTLEPGEYYYKRADDKVVKVYVSDIFPHDNGTLYGCRYVSNGQRVHTGYEWDGIPKRHLYDNKQDCRDDAHMMCDWWEDLREQEIKLILQDGES